MKALSSLIQGEFLLDGELHVEGKDSKGGRGGGGAGGSITILTNQMAGTGLIDVHGGAVMGTATCGGGGGGGGRVAIHSAAYTFTGTIRSHGGAGGNECGGAGTVLLRDTTTDQGTVLS